MRQPLSPKLGTNGPSLPTVILSHVALEFSNGSRRYEHGSGTSCQGGVDNELSVRSLAYEAEIPADGGIKKVPRSVFSFRTRALTCIRADHPSPRLIQAK